MKLASISVVAFSLLITGAAMGCSSGSGRGHATDTGVHNMDAGIILPGDTGIGPRDTGFVPNDSNISVPTDTNPPRPDTGGGTSCSITCTSDSQCASSCGAVPGGGTRCCDTSTMRCFVSHSTCPAPARDGGTTGY